MPEVDEICTMLALAGPHGVVAAGVGAIVLGWGIRMAVRRASRAHALALFAASFLPLPVAAFGGGFGEFASWELVTMVRPTTSPSATAAEMLAIFESRAAATTTACWGMGLALAGATVALARSRPDPVPRCDRCAEGGTP